MQLTLETSSTLLHTEDAVHHSGNRAERRNSFILSLDKKRKVRISGAKAEAESGNGFTPVIRAI